MDMHAAYREVGSYRAAAEICGTTPKTVKRSVLAARAAENGEVPVVAHNYDGVRRPGRRPDRAHQGEDLGQAVAVGGPSRRLSRDRLATSAGWWPR